MSQGEDSWAGGRVPSPLGLSVLSGVLLALSFPKYGHGAVAFVALVPLLVAIARDPAHGARLGFVAGAVWSLGALHWTARVVMQFGGLSLPLALGAMVLACLVVSLFPLLFGWGLGRWVRARGRGAVLAAPVFWVATEVLRAHTFFHFPWCLLGYSQSEHVRLVQVASLAGIYGVSFVVAGVSAALACALLAPGAAARRAAVAGSLALLSAVWGFGHLRLSGADTSGSASLRVGLVQPSILQAEKWDPQRAQENLQRQIALTREAAAGGARLVIWPESSLPGFLDRSPRLAGQLGALVRELDIYLLFGNDDVQLDGETRRIYVGAKMLTPEGLLSLRYHKLYLVPFGEYVPLEPLFTLGGRFSGRLVSQVGQFVPGTEALVASVDGELVGAFICYEAIFPALTREFVHAGASLLVNVTNDGWYGRSSAPYQHFAMARLRAVESGRYLVRVANTGISAVVDPYGRVEVASALFERRAIVADVALRHGRTPYTRYGDVLAWSCLAAALLATALTFRPSQR